MKFILGKKVGMTQVFKEDGTVVPVTRVQAGPCVVTQVKTKAHDGVDSIQVGFGSQKVVRLPKANQGHLRAIATGEGQTVRHLREIKMNELPALKRGDTFTVRIFAPGEKVKVVGQAKGKGFQGVVKRHGFSGSPATHGHKDQLRMPGSIGATGPQRVFKGTRMGGHMGTQQVTIQNLEIVSVDIDQHELLIKGALPGARNGLLLVMSPEGALEAEVVQIAPETVSGETKQTETAAQEPVEAATETTAAGQEEISQENTEPAAGTPAMEVSVADEIAQAQAAPATESAEETTAAAPEPVNETPAAAETEEKKQ